MREKSLLKKFVDGGVIMTLVTALFVGYANVSKDFDRISSLETSVYGNGSIDSSIAEQLSGIRHDMAATKDDVHIIKEWLRPDPDLHHRK